MKLRTLYCLLFAFMLVHRLDAQHIITPDPKGEVIHIGTQTELFEDSTAAMTIEQVADASNAARFRPSQFEVPNYNVTKSAVWMHFFVRNTKGSGLLLMVDPPSTRDVELYRRRADGTFELRKTGMFLPDSTREINTSHFFFHLDVSEHDTSEYFLRIANYEPVQIDARIGRAEFFMQMIRAEDMINIFCFGLMWMMIIYNVYLFITNRERAYLYYVLYVFFNFYFTSFVTGYLYHYPPFMKFLVEHAAAACPAIMATFGVLFSIRFLDTRIHAPFFHKVFIGIAVIIVGLGLLSVFQVRHEPVMGMEIVALIYALVSIATAVAVFRKGNKSARFYLFGFGFYTICLAVFVLGNLHVFPINDITMNSMQVGSCVEAICLSFALGHKMNMLKGEKEVAQEEALANLRENERIVREQNVMLEEKVKERTVELAQKNKDITDSINYAKRIQQGILPSEEELAAHLGEYFVLYKPKDIVSGDFYWLHHLSDGSTLLAAVDCTGHGVPGAFMSILGHTLLNQAIESGLLQPAQILNYINEQLPRNLKAHGKETSIRDGMDISLCRIDRKRNEVVFSGANNPVWLMSNSVITVFKADKQAITASDDMEKRSFTNQRIETHSGDILYLFTDGYADQFGGPGGKKFKYKQMQQTLMGLATSPLNEQHRKMDATIEAWKGDLEQVDDILLIGVKMG